MASNINILPQSNAYEETFIGILLFNLTSSDKRSQLLEILTEDDFCNPKWLLVFSNLKKYLATLSDPSAYSMKGFVEFLHNKEILKTEEEVGNFLNTAMMLSNDTPCEEQYESYLIELQNFTRRRKLVISCQETLKKAYSNEQNIDKLIENNINEMNKINDLNPLGNAVFSNGKKECEKLINIFSQMGDTLTDSLIIPSGLTLLDEKIKGFKPGELSIIAARPSCGKTALATTIILNILSNPCSQVIKEDDEFIKIEKNIKVAFFSLEMTKESIVKRMLSTYAYIPANYVFGLKEIKGTKYIERLRTYGKNLENVLQNLIIYDKSELTILKFKNLARKLKKENDIDIIFIDYLTLMKVENSKYKEEWQTIGEISSSLKDLAKELNISIVCLSQLNREAEDQEPKLSNLRNSGAIEQDADLVLLLHDPNRNNQKTTGYTRVCYTQGDYSYTCLNAKPIKLKISKQRNGETGSFNLMFLSDYVKFVDIKDCQEDKNINFNEEGVHKI